MLVILRLVFGVALLYEMVEGAKNAAGTGEAGDLTGASYLVVCVGLGILNAMVWAPYLGAKVSGPLTGVMTESTYVERINWVSRIMRWSDARGYRRVTAVLCFWEAIRHPSSPTAYVVGLKNARRDSWLEKVYAREVFRFNNTQNSVQAYLTLKRHGIDPRPHRNQEVNIMLLSLEKPPRPEPSPVAVPAAPRVAPLARNPRIRLFRDAPAGPAAESESPESPSMAESALVEEPPVSTALPPGEPERVEGLAGTSFARALARLLAFLRAP